jgi:hypothetical protein
MARITFPDGRWIDLRPMWVNDELAVEELGQAGSEADAAEGDEAQAAYQRYTGMLRKVRGLLDGATIATSWDGDAGQMTRDDMLGLLGQWRNATEDDAVPPSSGASS